VTGLLLAAFAALAGSACSASTGQRDADRPVVAYSGPAAKLFDDAIDPAAVGLDYDKGYSPRADKSLRERSQTGDAVIRVRVATVTAKTDGPETVYQLGLHAVEKLTGKNPPPADFTVQITKTSESLGIMKNFESRLVGYAFVAFVREFGSPNGEREVHFHLAPDTKDVKTAVGDAMLLGELK
jgi:uncharacterized protein (DUF885 family)